VNTWVTLLALGFTYAELSHLPIFGQRANLKTESEIWENVWYLEIYEIMET